jgi:oxygen-independent coproporphyrinogen-3 oxidase
VDDVVRRDVIQRLMCKGELTIGDIETRYALEFVSYFASELTALEPLTHDGLVSRHDTGITVTERGRALLRNVAMVFDAYLRPTGSPQYSKVI